MNKMSFLVVFLFLSKRPLAGQGYVLGALHDDFQLDANWNSYGYNDINFIKFTIDTTADVNFNGALGAASLSLSGDLSMTGNTANFSSAQEVTVSPDQDNEATNKAYVDTAVAANTSALATETSTRASAVTALQSDVDQNESDADAAIAAEASTARAAEQANADDILSNTTNISNNTTNISNNSTDIATNSTNISANTGNVTTNTTNISLNATAITAEVTRAEAAEAVITNTIMAEADSRDSTRSKRIRCGCGHCSPSSSRCIQRKTVRR